jgi:Cu-processing system ATP-binding protein
VLKYFARLKRVALPEVEQLLEQVGLAAAAERRVKTYSKGMRQRLGLAQALLGEPRLLMLDEPTAGLDPTATREFYSMLDDLRGRGTTVLLSSHVLPGIEGHIDRAAILGQGRLLAAGSLDALRAEAALPLTIRVRGQWASEDWIGAITRAGMTVELVNGRQLEFVGPEASKLSVLRLLLDVPGIEDVDVFPPSLEALYVHFNQASVMKEAG